MGVLISWHGHKFELSTNVIRGFRDLGLSWGSETEEKEGTEGKYLSRKTAKPMELSMTIPLHACLNNSVEYEARIYLWEAKDGISDFMYATWGQMFPFPLMLTEARVDKVEMNPAGVWISCEVKVTFRQSIYIPPVVDTGTAGGGGSGGGGRYKLTLTDSRGNPVGQIEVNASSSEAAMKKIPESWKGTVEVQRGNGKKEYYDGTTKKSTSPRTVGYVSTNKSNTPASSTPSRESTLKKQQTQVDNARNKGRSQTPKNTKKK